MTDHPTRPAELAPGSALIDFGGEVVLVTGAGRGLGRAYARLLADRGAHVVVHDAGVDRNGMHADHAVADSVVREIVERGGKADARFEDLEEIGSGEALVKSVHRDHGRLDAVIHSAGISIHARLEDTDDETFARTLAISGRAAFELLRAALPIMRRQRYGRIVLTVSGHGLYPGPESDLVAYSMAKALQFGLLNSVVGEFENAGIHVNAISPVAATRMLTRDVGPNALSPDDVAPAVVFLASRSCSVSGLVVRAAGGRFSIGRYAVTRGVDLDGARPISPEMIGGAWTDITGGVLEAPQ